MPLVKVRVYGSRFGMVLSPLNHSVAPATLVKRRAVLRVGVELGLVADDQVLVRPDRAGGVEQRERELAVDGASA